ncbi:hypothetical protein BDZ94DRAFT_921967 [Collybia nuda]|uniref:Uncharacterized protein n=1 Tax=Collybia nuda TaxID=64659 RepID=A0A9P5XZE7_9AGAR|nr:hypothetical protein BDZ94DRAFT_921967 [Collybia nuda]
MIFAWPCNVSQRLSHFICVTLLLHCKEDPSSADISSYHMNFHPAISTWSSSFHCVSLQSLFNTPFLALDLNQHISVVLQMGLINSG